MWNWIRALPGCKSVWAPGPYGEMFLLPVPPDETLEPSCWMIGQYRDQTRLATDLRDSEELQEFVTDCRVRFGLRKADRPSADVARQERYGSTITGVHHAVDFTAQRIQPLAAPVRDGVHAINRRSDRHENVRTFWATQTPQSHHVVEFNHLRDVGVSREIGFGNMDHGQLPCVLLAAEFHQRYISSVLKQTHGRSADDLRGGLGQVYSSLYIGRSPLFKPLWELSKVILGAAGIVTH